MTDIPADAVVLCSTADKSAFADDVTCLCAGGCGKLLCFRPYIPATARKMCLQCVEKHLKVNNMTAQFSILKRTLDETRLYFAAKGPKQ